jgi:UDP-glucuronate decarboxylase
VGVARIFNTYGPRLSPSDGRVVSNFVVQALTNVEITIYGDGQQTRSFCYVDDLVDGLIRLAKADIQGPVNLGNPSEISMIELASRVIALTQSKSRLTFKPLPQDDPVRRRPDISLASDELQWSPKVNIDDGLMKTILWFNSFLQLEN